ncbi:MAG: LexA family transcriptional regulator [Armatimonadetes bacterium]|nr:LexA family transcriptional regulator [Armatimonadota bacterium]
MANDALAARAKAALEREGLTITDAARRMDVNYVTVWRITQGWNVSADSLTRFAHTVGEDAEEWMALGRPELRATLRRIVTGDTLQVSEGSEVYRPRPSDAWLPVCGTLRGGTMTHVEEDRAEQFPCLQEHAAQADYVVKIEGDSLYPLILEGDYVAVRKTSTATPGDIVVARYEDDTVVKRYAGRRGGRITLESVNPLYPPLAPDNVEILGVVVWQHRPKDTLRRFGR